MFWPFKKKRIYKITYHNVNAFNNSIIIIEAVDENQAWKKVMKKNHPYACYLIDWEVIG